MSTTTNVVPLRRTTTTVPSRVPPPGDLSVSPDRGWEFLPLTNSEYVVLLHLRDMPHHGPTCLMCRSGA